MATASASASPLKRFKRATATKIELRGRAIRLEADPSKTWPRWIQIAEQGLYLGHPSGPFEFDERVFAEIIRNFRALPEYRSGATPAQGQPGVIPFDWRHASEMSPLTGGAAAIEAQAAQGWIWELDMRKVADDVLGLWAFAEMEEPARSLIDANKIAWTSVCVHPDTTDRLTNQPIGCYLSSVALTNDPFIRGMVSAGTAVAAERYVDFYEIPKSASELVEALRALFGLSVQAPLADVLRELVTLRACASGQMPAPPGVDVVRLVGSLRRLFNLPTISPAADVFAACDQLLGAVAADEALAEAAEPPSSRLPPLTAAARRVRRAARTQKDIETMDTAALLALIAGSLKCSATPEEIGRTFPVFFAAAQKGAGAEQKLGAICAALGMDPDQVGAAVEKIKGTMAAAKALEDAMPELAEMYTHAVEAEDGAAEEDMKVAANRYGVQDMSQAQGLDAAALQGVFFARTGGAELERLPKLPDGRPDHKPLLDPAVRTRLFGALHRRRDAAKKYAEKVGAVRAEEQKRQPPPHHTHLFQRFAGLGTDGGQRGGAPDLMRGADQRAFEAGRGDNGAGAKVLDLSDQGDLAHVGGNPVARALFVVNRDKLAPPTATYDERHALACQLARDWSDSVQGQGPHARY